MEVDGIKISRLNSIDSVTDNDDFVVNSGGNTYKTRFSVIVGNIMNRFVNPIVDAINTAIGNEVSARQSADNILSEGLISETGARESADSSLGDRVSEVNGRLITYTLACDSNGNFPLPTGGKPPLDNKQIALIVRNAQTGAIYVVWYNTGLVAFRIGATITGSAPSEGNNIVVQYFA